MARAETASARDFRSPLPLPNRSSCWPGAGSWTEALAKRGPLLGTPTHHKDVHPHSKGFLRSSLRRSLQARLSDHRVGGCGRWVLSGRAEIKRSATGKAHFAGLNRCGSSLCPVCGSAKRLRLAQQIEQAITSHTAQGGHVAFLTLTTPFDRSTPAREAVRAVSGAWSRMFAGRNRSEFRSEFGAQHEIRVIEVTDTLQGWHPHIHALVFTTSPIDQDRMSDWLFPRWANAISALGQKRPSKSHAVRVLPYQGDPSRIAHYVAGTDDGLSRRSGFSRTVMQLARDGVMGDSRAWDRFCEWIEAAKGIHLTRWSRGAQEALGASEPLPEAEPSVTLAKIDQEARRTLWLSRADQGLLDAAQQGGLLGIARWIKSSRLPLHLDTSGHGPPTIRPWNVIGRPQQPPDLPSR